MSRGQREPSACYLDLQPLRALHTTHSAGWLHCSSPSNRLCCEAPKTSFANHQAVLGKCTRMFAALTAHSEALCNCGMQMPGQGRLGDCQCCQRSPLGTVHLHQFSVPLQRTIAASKTQHKTDTSRSGTGQIWSSRGDLFTCGCR